MIEKRKMTGRYLLAGMLIAGALSVQAKDKKGVIMTVAGEDVPSEEFIYLFEKNNTQQTQPQSLDEYLELFKNYRLKVAEAKSEGVDTTATFRKEMNQYRRELLDPYVSDTVFFNQLVDIAMEREKTVAEASHIMIIRTHQPERDSLNLVLLDSLRQELLNGADFIEMAKKYSQDRFSSQKGGYLGFNPSGSFPYGFETAVYETPEGEISEIVESHVGWHIIKAGAKKPAEELKIAPRSYEEVKADVERKSASPFDTRYHEIRAHRLEMLKERHKALAARLSGAEDDEAYEVLMEAEEASQYNHNLEYRNLVDEYVNGSLLYEVSVKNVWDKAGNDEDGLQAFYNANKDKYTWSAPHAKGVLVQAINDSVAQEIKNGIVGFSPEEVVTYVKENHKKVALAERFNIAKGSNAIIDYLVFGEGDAPDQTQRVYFVSAGFIADEPEELNDVRNQVVSDYQEVLESQWTEELKQKYPVEVNTAELKRIKKTISGGR